MSRTTVRGWVRAAALAFPLALVACGPGASGLRPALEVGSPQSPANAQDGPCSGLRGPSPFAYASESVSAPLTAELVANHVKPSPWPEATNATVRDLGRMPRRMVFFGALNIPTVSVAQVGLGALGLSQLPAQLHPPYERWRTARKELRRVLAGHARRVCIDHQQARHAQTTQQLFDALAGWRGTEHPAVSVLWSHHQYQRLLDVAMDSGDGIDKGALAEVVMRLQGVIEQPGNDLVSWHARYLLASMHADGSKDEAARAALMSLQDMLRPPGVSAAEIDYRLAEQLSLMGRASDAMSLFRSASEATSDPRDAVAGAAALRWLKMAVNAQDWPEVIEASVVLGRNVAAHTDAIEEAMVESLRRALLAEAVWSTEEHMLPRRVLLLTWLALAENAESYTDDALATQYYQRVIAEGVGTPLVRQAQQRLALLRARPSVSLDTQLRDRFAALGQTCRVARAPLEVTSVLRADGSRKTSVVPGHPADQGIAECLERLAAAHLRDAPSVRGSLTRGGVPERARPQVTPRPVTQPLL